VPIRVKKNRQEGSETEVELADVSVGGGGCDAWFSGMAAPGAGGGALGTGLRANRGDWVEEWGEWVR